MAIQTTIDRLLSRASKYSFPLYSWNERRVGFRSKPSLPEVVPEFRNAHGEVLDLRAILAELVENGAVAIEHYYPADYIDLLQERLANLRNNAHNGSVNSSALFGKEFGYEDTAEQGVFRLYHADQKVPELERYRGDPLIKILTEAYYGRSLRCENVMYQYNAPTAAGTRGWHIDSWLNQFKPFLYLSDVTEDNGPFTYLIGSHKNQEFLLRKAYACWTKNERTDVSEQNVSELGLKSKSFVAGRGTLILADTKGVHRGGALASGTRSAAVLYLYA